MHATISFFFSPIVNMNRVEHACIINVWGFTEILPFVLFCLPNTPAYGRSSVLWDSFSFKTLLEESSITRPDRYGDLRRTADFAGKLLRMRSSDESSATDACLWQCAQSETGIRISCGTVFEEEHPRGSVARFWQRSPPFFPTRLTTPGSPKMVTCGRFDLLSFLLLLLLLFLWCMGLELGRK